MNNEAIAKIALGVSVATIITYSMFGGAKAEDVEAIIMAEQMPTTELIRDTEVVFPKPKPQWNVDKYTVKKGDTIFSIARKHNKNPFDLMKINRCKKCALKVGQELKLD